MIGAALALLLSGPLPLALPLPLDDAPGAVAFLLEGVEHARQTEAPPPAAGGGWDGSLASGIARSLFWGYRFLLSSQDSISCGFEPSCSRFSQEAFDEHGFLVGLLATMDRLSRDTPLAIPFYPIDLQTGLLEDPPERYCVNCK